MKNKERNNIVICPPCGENVALATKRGANKVSSILPLLPRLTAVLPPQGREITTHGFTLIELLVVVLIIGILAAVAVPQYRVATEKSRTRQVLGALSSIVQAEEAFYLANGKYTEQMDSLDVKVSAPVGWSISLDVNDTYQSVNAYRKGSSFQITWHFQQSKTSNANKPFCGAQVNDSVATNICKAFGGKSLGKDNTWMWYSLL